MAELLNLQLKTIPSVSDDVAFCVLHASAWSAVCMDLGGEKRSCLLRHFLEEILVTAVNTLIYHHNFPKLIHAGKQQIARGCVRRVAPPRLEELDAEERKRRDEYIRAGGFVGGRPPDDLDKLSTFDIAEVPLPGQLLLGLGGFLFLALVVFFYLNVGGRGQRQP